MDTAGPRGAISLRKRLILAPAAIAVVASALTMGILVHEARQRVLDERVSASDLAEQLIRETLSTVPQNAEDPLAALARVIGSVPGLRHVRLFVLARQQEALESPPPPRAGDHGAPHWFAALLRPPPWSHWQEIRQGGRPLGYAVVVADPDDEIAELWHELILIGGLLAALTAIFVALVSWSVSRALRPLALLNGGIDRLAEGDFTTTLPPLGVAELSRLGDKFNGLAEALNQISRDNRHLIGQLISLQESERSLLAHELHDELGPSLFGIKAQAACILRRDRGTTEEGHARAILSLADELQKLNRRILGRLRPMALQDLGLPEAMAQLVEDWRQRKPDTDWRFDCSGLSALPDEGVGLTLYRVAQECLTNAARHSGATQVTLEVASGPAGTLTAPGLGWEGAADAPLVRLSIRDDGRGLAPDRRQGFGLLGIRERVRGHGGVVRIRGEGGPGVRIDALLPLGPLAPLTPLAQEGTA